jgi:hypothetical protein
VFLMAGEIGDARGLPAIHGDLANHGKPFRPLLQGVTRNSVAIPLKPIEASSSKRALRRRLLRNWKRSPR